MKCLQKVSLNTWIFLAMIIGALLGLLSGDVMIQFKFIGDIWLNLLKMVVIPLIVGMTAIAVGSQKDLKTLGRIALRVIIYYVSAAVLATTIGLAVASITQPGKGMSLAGFETTEVASGGAFSFSSFALNLFSDNMFASFANGNMMQTLIIGILLGVAILCIKEEQSKQTVLNWLQSMTDMIFSYISIVIKLAPVGIVFLMADSFANYGFAVFTSMASLIGTLYLTIIAHILLVYLPLLWITARMGPIRFLRLSMPVWTFAFASCSSAASIPITIKCLVEEFKIPRRIVDFTIPLGSQIGSDGSAMIYAGVLMFICQMNNIPYTLPMLFQMVIVASLISASGGGIPNGALVKLMIVVGAFGLPIEIIGVIAGFFRFFDMGSTMVNVLGDLVGTISVTSLEKRRAKRLGLNWEKEMALETKQA